MNRQCLKSMMSTVVGIGKWRQVIDCGGAQKGHLQMLWKGR